MVTKSQSVSSASSSPAASTRTIQSVYTDGACSGNPGPGGWGTVIYFTDGSVQELGGGDAQTTNNRMEMQAAIQALEYLLASDAIPDQPLPLYTDSEYVKNGVTQWLAGWKKKGWKTAAGKPVLNQDLWLMLDRLQAQVTAKLALQWRYVKGHSGDRGNDRCDEIARAFSLGRVPNLRQADLPQANLPVEPAAFPPGPALEAVQSSHSVQQSIDQPAEPLALQAAQAKSQPDPPPTLANVSDSPTMTESLSDALDVPREVKVAQLRNVVETLHMADEIARQGYLITSSELADLMDVNASAVTSRGDNWIWRNWAISRVRREGNQILWQLERAE